MPYAIGEKTDLPDDLISKVRAALDNQVVILEIPTGAGLVEMSVDKIIFVRPSRGWQVSGKAQSFNGQRVESGNISLDFTEGEPELFVFALEIKYVGP